MKIDRSQAEHVARLARLELTPEELERFRGQLDAILQYMDKLREVDTSGVEPTSHVIPLTTVIREDEVKASLPQEISLTNAPEREGSYFKVPRIVG